MKYGLCIAAEDEAQMRALLDCGYDYVEANFRTLATRDAEKYRRVAENMKTYGLPCLAANCFLPGDLKSCGAQMDRTALADHIKRGLSRGKEFGLQKVVFGSGNARNVPKGADFAECVRQTVSFLAEVAAPLFEEYDTILVIEPLRAAECNLIHTVKEATMLAAWTGSDRIFTLADLYHMRENGDAFYNITDLKGYVRHAHISYPVTENDVKRRYPRSFSEYDYIGFLRALQSAGCDTCSVEAVRLDFPADAVAAMKVFRETEKRLEDETDECI